MDVSTIFTTLSNIVTGFIGIFGDIFADTGIISIFWDSTTGIKFLGALLLMAIGLGLVKFGFGFVRRLIKMRG